MSRELLPGEVEGWRAWLVVGPPRVPRLLSPAFPGDPMLRVWPTSGFFEADCRKIHVKGYHRVDKSGEQVEVEPEPPPGVECSCGVYAARSWRELVRQGYATAAAHERVVGLVGLSGKVIRGERAHRASKARVVELWVPFERWRWAEPLAVAYGVPVTLAHIEKPKVYLVG